MTFNSPSSSSIFEGGKLKPGVYKIQNLCSQTYLDIHEHTRETCCRPAQNLEKGRGLWEIKPLGAGYSVQKVEVEPGKPDQFCAPMEGLNHGTPLFVGAYPVAWRIERFADDKHPREFEYVRIFWGTTKTAWDLHCGHAENGTKVHFWEKYQLWHIWKLIPVKIDGVLTSSESSSEADAGSLPSYYEDTSGKSSTHVQRTASENDEFGTIVNEVTVVTTVTNSTVTTRKRYRVEDA